MLSVLANLNDQFDSTDELLNERITGLNQAASAMYSNATQSLQVTIWQPASFHQQQRSWKYNDSPLPLLPVCPSPPVQLLLDLLGQTSWAEQSIMAKAAATLALLMQSNLLNTRLALSLSALDSPTTQRIEDGYTDLAATALGDFTACLQHAAPAPKTYFSVFRYSTPSTANTTEPVPTPLR